MAKGFTTSDEALASMRYHLDAANRLIVDQQGLPDQRTRKLIDQHQLEYQRALSAAARLELREQRIRDNAARNAQEAV